MAAAHALARGVARVAIVDFDVHHGNGTQEIFEADPRVLYVSTHQWPFYPGTGRADEVGRAAPGAGSRSTCRSSAAPPTTTTQWCSTTSWLPITRLFNPELVAHLRRFRRARGDPLGGMRMSADGFACLTGRLCAVADDCAAGRVVLVTEGGYHLRALAASLRASLSAMEGGPEVDRVPGAGGDSTGRGLAAAAQARAVQSAFWRGL